MDESLRIDVDEDDYDDESIFNKKVNTRLQRAWFSANSSVAA